MSESEQAAPAPTGACKFCEQGGAPLRVDCYASELHGDDTEHFICDACDESNAREI